MIYPVYSLPIGQYIGKIVRAFQAALAWAFILFFFASLIAGCGVTIKPVTNIWVVGDNNRFSETIRTDNKPDITTDATASVPVSALP